MGDFLNKSIYVCRKCGSSAKRGSGSLSEMCCGVPMAETDADPVEWLDEHRSRGKAEDQEYNRQFFAKYIEPYGQFDREAGAFRLMKMGDITQEEYEQSDAYKRVCAIVEANTRVPEKNIPKCIVCGSTNLQRITTTKKVGAAALFGLFSAGYASKTFKCNNCGATF